MGDELKVQRRQCKAAVTRHRNSIQQFLAEDEFGKARDTIQKLKDAFSQFSSAHDDYHETLTDKDEVVVNESEQYFYDVQKDYIQALNDAKNSLKASDIKGDIKANAKSELNQSQLIGMLNLPKVEISKFNGDPLHFHSFISTFDETVHATDCSSKVKLARLLQYTSGKAHEAIQSCAMMPGDSGYSRARELLAERFGSDHLVTERLVHNLHNGKTVKSTDDLVKLADELVTCQLTLQQLRRLSEVETQTTIVKVAERLPNYLRNRWKRDAMSIRADKSRYPLFGEFVEFVSREATLASDPVYGNLGKAVNPPVASNSSGMRPNKSNTFNGKTESTNAGQHCVICKTNHKLMYCHKFKAMRVSERVQLVKKHNLCEVCLWGNHVTKDCRLDRVCSVEGCGQRHTKFLHVNSVARNSNSDAVDHSSSNLKLVSANVKADGDVHLPVVGVRINDSHQTCALLDSGSSNSFISKALALKLQLQSTNVSFSLNTLSDSKQVSSGMVSFKISSLDGSKCLHVSNVFIIDEISLQTTFPSSIEFPHLKGKQFLASGQQVNLLIGQDNSEALIPLEVSTGAPGEPFACRTLFGWSLNGPDREFRKVNRDVTSNFITSDVQNDLNGLWNVEVEGLSSGPDELSPSIQDKRVLELWGREKRMVDGHYQLPIPWKPNIDVPNNFSHALSRLKSLKSNLVKRDLLSRYDSEMLKLIDAGYAELVPSTEIGFSDKSWYLPHHGVINDKRPEKLRVVFDCAAKFRGESLNDKVYQGPDLNNKLLDVLLRFRQHSLCFSADIEAMYSQVLIPEEDRDALRFLWFNPEGDVMHYRMTRHVFGGVWCSSSSTFALRQTVVDNPHVDSDIANVVMNDFYVDDCLVSVPSVNEGIRLALGVTNLLSFGGFKLTKFVSNESMILASVPEEDRAKGMKTIGLLETCSKVLGLHWDIDHDNFFFLVNVISNQEVTKRSMLRTVASIYDPLGFLAVITLAGKICFQDACRYRLDWDDEVPLSLKVRWQHWLDVLSRLNDIRIPRCIKPSQFDDAALELHHICDSSQLAYGCCTYLRCTGKNGDIHCTLLYSKNKVAPIKAISVPRLELQAAVVAAKVDSMVRQRLSLQLLESTFWTDSELVIKWISNESSRFHVYVANRVSCIRSLSIPQQWNHISGLDNPSDLLTRECDPNSIELSAWFTGPAFLSTHKSEWNIRKVDTSLSVHDSETKKVSHLYVTCVQDVPPVVRLLLHYSSWHRLLKGVAWLLRFRDLLRGIPPPDHNYLSPGELQCAEESVIRCVQDASFATELSHLSRGTPIPKFSPVRALDPFLDERGILRVGGRLKNAKLGFDERNPVLLPHTHPVALLIVRHYQVAHLSSKWAVSLIQVIPWTCWIREYVPSLQQRFKWSGVVRNLKVGDLVLMVQENSPRNIWPMALVVDVYPSDDDLVRTVKVRTKSSSFVRPITKLVLLECA